MKAVADLDRIAIEDGASDYQAVSGLAVLGLVVGGMSCLVLNDVAFGFIPVAGVAVNWRALRRIRELRPALLGRPLALGGLALSLIFGLSAPLISLGCEQVNRAQAIAVARSWFEALRDNRPDVAHQWMMPRWMRVPEGESIASEYARPSGRLALENLLKQPPVRTLLKLGKRSHVRYVRNVASKSSDEERTIVDVYAVTVRSEQETVSFLLEMTVKAHLNTLNKQWSWDLNQCKFLSSDAYDGQELFDSAAQIESGNTANQVLPKKVAASV